MCECAPVGVCICAYLFVRERDVLRASSEDSQSTVPAHLREGGGNVVSDILEFRSMWVCGGRNQETGERQRKRNQVGETEKRVREPVALPSPKAPSTLLARGPLTPRVHEGPAWVRRVSPLCD